MTFVAFWVGSNHVQVLIRYHDYLAVFRYVMMMTDHSTKITPACRLLNVVLFVCCRKWRMSLTSAPSVLRTTMLPML